MSRGARWCVRARGASRASGVFDTKRDAVGHLRALAKKSSSGQVVIKRADGTIQTEHTYERDPFPPAG
jgi:hypothetical protein